MSSPAGPRSESSKPRLAAFPKAYLDELCVTGEMDLQQWFELAAQLGVDGSELYAGALELADRSNWPRIRKQAETLGLALPMLCCSPDFTHPDPEFRARQINLEKQWIDMCGELGGRYCRILSGQGRPDVSREEGLEYCVEAFEQCCEYAAERGIVLVLENHFKDPYWEFPEFAQASDVFVELLRRVPAENLAVNFDPSNALIAGEEPLDLLDQVIERVATMHASDRYLMSPDEAGNSTVGSAQSAYGAHLKHGEVGKGLNDYDAIFSRLANSGFRGWISIEDGVEGFEELQGSARFLHEKIGQYW